jgi:RNA polymerase sigma-70 factor (ECF subfamily)
MASKTNIQNESVILDMLHKDEQSRRRAFESIVQANSEQLYWHIRQMVLNHDDANDILQNTFIKAWTNID